MLPERNTVHMRNLADCSAGTLVQEKGMTFGAHEALPITFERGLCCKRSCFLVL